MNKQIIFGVSLAIALLTISVQTVMAFKVYNINLNRTREAYP